MWVVTDDFGFTLDQVNWFSNIVSLTYLPVSILVPITYSRFGIQRSVRFRPLSSPDTCWPVRISRSVWLLPHSSWYHLGYDTPARRPCRKRVPTPWLSSHRCACMHSDICFLFTGSILGSITSANTRLGWSFLQVSLSRFSKFYQRSTRRPGLIWMEGLLPQWLLQLVSSSSSFSYVHWTPLTLGS